MTITCAIRDSRCPSGYQVYNLVASIYSTKSQWSMPESVKLDGLPRYLHSLRRFQPKFSVKNGWISFASVNPSHVKEGMKDPT